MSKYDTLRDWLRACGRSEVSLSFAELEQILGFALPPSARKYAQWWENVGSPVADNHPRARAWHAGGYRASADRARQRVSFTRRA